MKRYIVFLISCVVLFSSCSTIYQTSYTLSNVSGATSTIPNELVSSDDNLSIGYSLSGNLRFTNKSDVPIVVDMANSFFGDSQGMKSLYTNAVTTTMTANSVGASVNLGGVASALGAPTGVTKIAYGTNIGGGTTSGTTVQTFQDRFVIIPPKSFRDVNEGYTIQKALHNDSFEYLITYGLGNQPTEYVIRRDKINFKTRVVATNVMRGAASQGVVQVSKNEYRTIRWENGGAAGYVFGLIGGIYAFAGLIGLLAAIVFV